MSDLNQKDIQSLIHPFTNLKAHENIGPLVMSHGKGIYVYDDQGRKYLDAVSSLWCANLGFSHEPIIEAINNQLKKLPTYHIFNGRTHEGAALLADRLTHMAPDHINKVFFANSGSEANDTAIKFCWYYNNAIGKSEKKKIIALNEGYHGVTIGAGSLTGLSHVHDGFDLPRDWVLRADCPHFYRYGFLDETEDAFVKRLTKNLEELIIDNGPETIAAMIVEPVQGAGGVRVPPLTYFPSIQKILKKYDILMISDEVICGFGRTGNLWGFESMGFSPDIITVAKGLSSAYIPISGILLSDTLYDVIAQASDEHSVLGHGFTNSAHPIATAAALACLDIYENTDLLDHVNRISKIFLKKIHTFKDHPLVGETRGIGLLAGIEIVKNKETRENYPESVSVAKTLERTCLEEGILTRALRETLCFCPPYITTEGELEELFKKFDSGVNKGYKQLRDQGILGAV